MSTQFLMLPPRPVDGVTADGGTAPLRAGVAYPVGIARVAGVASLDEPEMRAGVEHRTARPIDAGPEVYCRMRGAEHAARGFAPCADLGCSGCSSGVRPLASTVANEAPTPAPGV